MHEVDEIDAGSPQAFDYGTNEDTSDSDEPGLHELVTAVLPCTIVAAVKTAQYIKSRREDKKSKRNKISSTREADNQAAIAAVVPAGWYVDASDATQLHYWDGTERAERRALTDKLTAVPAQPRTRNRTTATPQKDKQHREDEHRPAQAPDLAR